MGTMTELQAEWALASYSNQRAELALFREAGKQVFSLNKQGKLPYLKIVFKDGIGWIQTRFKVKLSFYFGASELPVVMGSSRLGHLICQDAHDKCHKAEFGSLAVSRQTSFVVGAQTVLNSIRKRCMVCKKKSLEREQQAMGDMPGELQHPEPAFTRVSLDLWGPVMLRADIRRRSLRTGQGLVKGWVLAIVCSVTSAVKLFVLRDYSAEGFLEK